MSDLAYMQYTDDDTGVVFRYWGGVYIDEGYIDADGEFHAHACINVWDYETSEATVRTLAQFEQACREWLADEVEEDDDE